MTKPEEIGKVVGGGIAFEALKSLYDRVAPAFLGTHGHAGTAPPEARNDTTGRGGSPPAQFGSLQAQFGSPRAQFGSP